MTLRLYNTLTRTKEEFKPLDPINVRMYICGPTVYDYAHIGNARPVIVFDVLFRLLRHLYGPEHVTYVRNITDIDDKINARAKEEGTPIRELTERTLRQFNQDISALGVLPPTHEPRATDSIPEMIALIEKLIASGHAYAAEGHVLFHVPSMKDYGRLSRRALDEMIAGARVDVAPYKRDPMDFVLWKPSDAETPGWDSPWGRGRPGWHIECSAMSWKFLGEVFDIHGGGVDLIFPHHENEIAQSLCAFGTKQMARVWMHNGFLQVEGQKMSKSLGNFVTIHDVLQQPAHMLLGMESRQDRTELNRKWNGLVARLAMLTTNYRQPIDWTQSKLGLAASELMGWYERLKGANYVYNFQRALDAAENVVTALKDDLNTNAALTVLRTAGPIQELGEGMRFLGLLDPAFLSDDWLSLEPDLMDKVNQLKAARDDARKAKNWAESDRIRDELAAMGVTLKDNKDGTTTWEVKR
jgi:cysteinyl-tRNA synthetase